MKMLASIHLLFSCIVSLGLKPMFPMNFNEQNYQLHHMEDRKLFKSTAPIKSTPNYRGLLKNNTNKYNRLNRIL